MLPPTLFFLKIIRSKLWESHLAKKKDNIYSNFVLIIPLWRAKIKTYIDWKKKKQVFLTESKEQN